MDNNQQLLTTLLSCAIRGKQLKNIDTSNADWRFIFEEAKAHQVYDIIFPVLQGLETCSKPVKEIMEQWTASSLLNGINQTIKIEGMAGTLKKFNELGIPVISLKGLVLRELYPEPSLRSMSDADILIQREDFDRAKTLLEALGYFSKDISNAKEACFFHKTNIMIELHWLLIEPDHIKNTEKFENSVWINAERSLLNDVPITILSPEDNIIYLFMHMVMHIKYRGFGLRQLCDLVLLIEAKREVINWTSFCERIKEFGIEKFVQISLLACKELFDLDTPFYFPYFSNDDMVVNSLIDDVFASGVFGYKSSARSYIRNTINSLGDEPDIFSSKTKLYLRNLFPKSKSFFGRYEYARKFPILLPVAWVHRIFLNLFKGHFSDKFSFLFKVPEGTDTIFVERIKLLKWLNLQ